MRKTRELVLIYDEIRFRGVAEFSKEDIVFKYNGKKVLVEHSKIISITFDNVAPQLNSGYITFENQTYCTISYNDNVGNNNKLIFRTTAAIRKFLNTYYVDLLENNTNDKSFKPFSTISVSAKNESNKKAEKIKSSPKKIIIMIILLIAVFAVTLSLTALFASKGYSVSASPVILFLEAMVFMGAICVMVMKNK